MTHTIRLLSVSDWALLKQLRLEALLNHPTVYAGNYDSERNEPTSYWCKLLKDPFRAYFALSNNKCPIGLAGVFRAADNVNLAILTSFYINSLERGQGLSKLLFAATEEWARLNGYSASRVYHRESNQISKRMIVSNGYKLKGSEMKQWPDGDEVQFYYEKNLV